jgi:hypothetical protein
VCWAGCMTTHVYISTSAPLSITTSLTNFPF